MATDIAFVVGLMALFGSRVPAPLKLFLLALAIVDDLLAVVVIALFYAETIHGAALGAAALVFAAMVAMRMLGVRALGVYWAAGAMVWLAMLKSGVHPTIAGVALGLLTPARPLVALPAVERAVRAARERIGKGDRLQRVAWAKESSALVQETVSPVERLEVALHPWVAFVILPVFALANAGVELTPDALTSPLALSIAAALVIGKPLGILAATALIVRLGWARLPAGVSWGMIGAAGSLAGIGFTMALFVASMGLSAGLIDAGKTGVLVGSAVSAALGSWLLLRTTRRHA
jgi:NhaA family Na+:H+ antiporter